MAEPQKFEKTATEAVHNIYEAVREAANGRKEEAKEKRKEAKHSVSLLVSHGLSKAEGLVHSAKEYVDNKRVAKVDGKFVHSDSVSKDNAAKSSQFAAGDAAGSGTTVVPGGAENQPLLVVNLHTQTSWKTCCGLFDCLTSSD